MSKQYFLTLLLTCLEAGNDDLDAKGEFYGAFGYQTDGQLGWTTIVETSDSNPWTLQADSLQTVMPKTQTYLAKNKVIEVPDSATFMRISAWLKEYDPTALNPDEDLGTQTITLSLSKADTSGEWQEVTQGSPSIGQVNWSAQLGKSRLPI